MGWGGLRGRGREGGALCPAAFLSAPSLRAGAACRWGEGVQALGEASFPAILPFPKAGLPQLREEPAARAASPPARRLPDRRLRSLPVCRCSPAVLGNFPLRRRPRRPGGFVLHCHTACPSPPLRCLQLIMRRAQASGVAPLRVLRNTRQPLC